MDSTSKKVTKTKGRLSLGLARPVPAAETSSDLNGQKDTGELEEKVMDNSTEPVATQQQADSESEPKEKPQQGKKRKLEDIKDSQPKSDESNAQFHGFEEDAEKIAVKEDKETNEALPPIPEPIRQESQLGKGKRSRIPNKKYASLETVDSEHDKSANGVANVSSTEDDDASAVLNMTKTSKGHKGKPGTSPGTPLAKKPKFGVDITNPGYQKPFDFGWKRELVFRATFDSNMKRHGDVYYYSPEGKKVRSMREVAEALKNKELTLDDFTFCKEPLCPKDAEKETIRDAKAKGSWQATPVRKSKGTPKSKEKITSPRTPVTKPSPAVAPTEEPTPSPTKTTPKTPRLGALKVKSTGSRLNNSTKKSRRQKPTQEHEFEIGMLPPNWSPKKEKSSPEKTPKQTLAEAPRAKGKRAAGRKSTGLIPVHKTEAPRSVFMQNYLQNVSYGYNMLLHVFQYLKVQDLLRAGCVCTLWRDLASHPSLWRTVRMKNSQVADWEGVANTLKKHATKNLDLRKMLLPNNSDDTWPSFLKAIAKVDLLRKIDLCRCPATVVEELAKTNPHLQVINAVIIKCEMIDLSPINNLENLRELRLKSTNGFSLTSDLSPLKNLTQLKHLGLTSIKELDKLNLDVIGELINLESLELGECSNFPEKFGADIISKLTKLEKLRLEKGQGTCGTFNILDAVSKIPTLEQLELVNFDVKTGFDNALGACSNIKKLLIIPTYISQSATTNHMVLGGVMKLKATLSHFVWGVTLELLRVTELFVDQCEDGSNKTTKKPTGNGDSIPVLKPVPIMKVVEDPKQTDSLKEPPQVEILPLPTLQKLLLNCLPTTRVKILKIPFHATWKQSIVDTVN